MGDEDISNQYRDTLDRYLGIYGESVEQQNISKKESYSIAMKTGGSMAAGAAIGAAIGGPPGAIFGAIFGALTSVAHTQTTFRTCE